MIKKIVKKSDICNCEIEYTFDDALDEKSRQYNILNVIKKCSLHMENLVSEHKLKSKLIDNKILDKNAYGV